MALVLILGAVSPGRGACRMSGGALGADLKPVTDTGTGRMPWGRRRRAVKPGPSSRAVKPRGGLPDRHHVRNQPRAGGDAKPRRQAKTPSQDAKPRRQAKTPTVKSLLAQSPAGGRADMAGGDKRAERARRRETGVPVPVVICARERLPSGTGHSLGNSKHGPGFERDRVSGPVGGPRAPGVRILRICLVFLFESWSPSLVIMK